MWHERLASTDSYVVPLRNGSSSGSFTITVVPIEINSDALETISQVYASITDKGNDNLMLVCIFLAVIFLVIGVTIAIYFGVFRRREKPPSLDDDDYELDTGLDEALDER